MVSPKSSGLEKMKRKKKSVAVTLVAGIEIRVRVNLCLREEERKMNRFALKWVW